MRENDCATAIIGAAIEVHRYLGPGLLDSAYELALVYELGERGLRTERQVRLLLAYKGIELPAAYRIDLLVDGLVIVEVKAIDELAAIHEAQLLTYLRRLSNKRLGLLLNFNVDAMRKGVRRIVNNL